MTEREKRMSNFSMCRGNSVPMALGPHGLFVASAPTSAGRPQSVKASLGPASVGVRALKIQRKLPQKDGQRASVDPSDRPTVDLSFCDEIMTSIFDLKPSLKQFEYYYEMTDQFFYVGRGALLYDRIARWCYSLLRDQARRGRRLLQTLPSSSMSLDVAQQLVRHFLVIWRDFEAKTEMMSSVFAPLNRAVGTLDNISTFDVDRLPYNIVPAINNDDPRHEIDEEIKDGDRSSFRLPPRRILQSGRGQSRRLFIADLNVGLFREMFFGVAACCPYHTALRTETASEDVRSKSCTEGDEQGDRLPTCVMTRELVSALLTMIEADRNDVIVDKETLRCVLEVMVALRVYDRFFAQPLYNMTSEYYAAESTRTLPGHDHCEYLRYVDERLRQERARLDNYVPHRSTETVIQLIVEKLIRDQTKAILAKPIEQLYESFAVQNEDAIYANENETSLATDPQSVDRRRDLATLFRYMSRFDESRASLDAHFGDFVKRRGTAIVMTDSSDSGSVSMKERKVMTALLLLNEQVSRIVRLAFESNARFIETSRNAFSHVVNIRTNKTAELLAKFLDQRLRVGNKELSEEKLEILMLKVIAVFRLINGKDYFESFYKRDLARRLLYDKSASFDSEKLLLSKLKVECGAMFTSKLEGMFKDIEVSRSMIPNYRHLRSPSNTTGGVDEAGTSAKVAEICVSVLSPNNWQNFARTNVLLPVNLQTLRDNFESFYQSAHKGRKLIWLPVMDFCLMQASFISQTKQFELSLYQALILLLYNDRDEMKFVDICEAIGLVEQPDERRLCLKNLLAMTSAGKVEILNVHSSDGQKRIFSISNDERLTDVADTDVFSINRSFTHKQVRIRINAIQFGSAKDEEEAVQEEVSADRIHLIDAAIVRNMKTKKTLSHQQLLEQLYAQLRFPLTAVDAKQRIESLIERDYMERDENDASLYNYRA